MITTERLATYLTKINNYLLVLWLAGGMLLHGMKYQPDSRFMLAIAVGWFCLYVVRFCLFLQDKVTQPIRIALVGLLIAAILGFAYAIYHSTGLI